jgi:hypothetical protein
MAQHQIPETNLDTEAEARQTAAEQQFPLEEKPATQPPPVYPTSFFDAEPVEF